MKTYSSREIIQILRKLGWFPVRQRGSHLHLAHPEKGGRVTVPHPKSDIGQKTLFSILDQAGLTLADIERVKKH